MLIETNKAWLAYDNFVVTLIDSTVSEKHWLAARSDNRELFTSKWCYIKITILWIGFSRYVALFLRFPSFVWLPSFISAYFFSVFASTHFFINSKTVLLNTVFVFTFRNNAYRHVRILLVGGNTMFISIIMTYFIVKVFNDVGSLAFWLLAIDYFWVP